MNHEPDCECFGCKARSISFAPSARGSKEASSINARDKRWDRDMAAYKSLRSDGLQPKGIDGCAELQTRAKDQFEIETSYVLNDEQRKQAKEGLAMMQDLGA